MSEITQDRLDRIVETADEILSALAGKNEDVHPDDSKKMCQLWDELNDSLAPPEVVKAIVLELSELRKEREAAVPVAYISKADLDAGYPHILARKDYSKACPMAVFAAPPAQPVAAPEKCPRSVYEVIYQECDGFVECSANAETIWNACRAAMLAAPGKEG
ncbi:hypothetical protein SMY59_002715 [Cronobacter sakazakii]|uniref:hypothetical protein n=1 Tax=Cronobacter sakazakii TaxID=28141 RepID=UPI000CF1319A|nr:hypothetical protein [Cronobacter sakazakii]ELY2632448.1 hypothetical protein [Cronobacter sakazakii]ELY4115258.1 hypothetical protein [Cronobacter sakazakii]ELY4496695.1 hypothetical protein [Cronobacter sakazakii]ELY5948103.1 hypothetical protein [Cronobacter sakazakii]PPY13966.1 hypothetical protein C3D82_01525 [Cronobacter sakazakii]